MFEDAADYSTIVQSLPVSGKRVETRADWEELFLQTERKCLSEDYRPMIHFDAHGSELELELASGEAIPWKEFVYWTTRLNVACRMNLVVTLGVCEGASSILGIRGIERAPYVLLLAPRVKLSAWQATQWASELYRLVLDDTNLVIALGSANAKVGLRERFVPYSFNELFELAIDGYVHGQGDRTSLRAKAAVLMRAARHLIDRPNVQPHAKSQIVDSLRMSSRNVRDMWAKYCLYDIDGNIQQRIVFPDRPQIEIHYRLARGKSIRREVKKHRRSSPYYGKLQTYYRDLGAEELTMNGPYRLSEAVRW